MMKQECSIVEVGYYNINNKAQWNEKKRIMVKILILISLKDLQCKWTSEPRNKLLN